MDTVTPTRPLRVGEVARAAGVTTDTIRYYEPEGLIPPPERTPSGYRAYPAGAVDRMAFIQGCQRLGLRLADTATCSRSATPASGSFRATPHRSSGSRVPGVEAQ